MITGALRYTNPVGRRSEISAIVRYARSKGEFRGIQMRHLYALNRALVYTAATTMFVALAIPAQVQAQDVDDGPEADAV